MIGVTSASAQSVEEGAIVVHEFHWISTGGDFREAEALIAGTLEEVEQFRVRIAGVPDTGDVDEPDPAGDEVEVVLDRAIFNVDLVRVPAGPAVAVGDGEDLPHVGCAGNRAVHFDAELESEVAGGDAAFSDGVTDLFECFGTWDTSLLLVTVRTNFDAERAYISGKLQIALCAFDVLPDDLGIETMVFECRT